MRNRSTKVLGILLSLVMIFSMTCCGGSKTENPGWSVKQNEDILEIACGSGTAYPQYAALHLSSGYLRMNYGPGSGWGTSVILLPSFWTRGRYYQGVPITATYTTEGSDLMITFHGNIAGLSVQGQVRLLPPSGKSLSAKVSVVVSGSLDLDNRPGEAFKPVILTSMHISPDLWDTQSAVAGTQTYQLPENGWIIQPPVSGNSFGFNGGTSAWKTNAPTVEISLGKPMEITGWMTATSDPNSDNAQLWAASASILNTWDYTVTARAN